MRRVISVFLRLWPVELRLRRLARSNSTRPDKPFVVADLDGQSQVIVASCQRAAMAGIGPGMTLAQARAVHPILAVAKADPADDAHTLNRLAVWFLRFSPLVAPDQPNGIWIDATGVAHLFGGEKAMLGRIVERLRRDELTASIAMAETPGAAWACARYGQEGVIPSGEISKALSPLPISGLRLSRSVVDSLKRVGLHTIGDLLRIPRATIPHRFGPDVMRRLDQALGRAPEPISPVLPPQAKRQHMAFAEPISTPEDLERTAFQLCERLCRDLEQSHEGVRRLDLLFFRTDGQVAAIRIGTSKPTRDHKHLGKMLTEKIVSVDPGFGIESATLTAWMTEIIVPRQSNIVGDVDIDQRELAHLTDRLSNRLGAQNVYRTTPVESDIPERAARRVQPGEQTSNWPEHVPRPLHLLTPPEPVDVTAMLPDHPPVMFLWRGRLHRIKRADGPERITGEWWQAPNEIAEIRDYFRVENEKGERFWLYRDNRLTSGGVYRWYLHGLFP